MTNKSILITGCSSGIGLTAAQTLKQRGYRVFASARKAEDVAKLKSLGLESIQLDVNNNDSIRQALTQVTQATGGTLDALFNNAGYVQPGAIEDLTRDINRAQFETNVFGPMELVRLVLPIMRAQGHGHIIQNSSILGVITLPYSGAYNASKFALEGFTISLRQELRGTNIQVSLLNPGPISSKLRDNAFGYYKLAEIESSMHEKAYAEMEKSYFHPDAKDRHTLADEPELVVKKLICALESTYPRTHYFVGWSAQFLAVLRRLLPDCALQWLLARVR